jgi:plastocyanin
VPSASPVASAQDLVQGLLDLASQVILPDWKGLVDLFPMVVLVLFIAWFALTVRKFATLGPSRRAPARVEPVTPPTVHMPGGSVAPILAALGAMGLFAGLVFGGVILAIGTVLFVATLIWWLREGMRDYAHLEPPQRLPAVIREHPGPPPGVHMPGPSIRPFLGALGAAALFGGLVIGGWVLILAVVFFVWTLLGWLFDFTAEYRKVEEADRTGHLENIPDRRFPVRKLQVFGVLFVLVTLWQLGIFPPAGPATAGDGGASPAPTAGGQPPGSIPVTAEGIKFIERELTVPAGQPFTIWLINKDTPSTPHDVVINGANGAPIKAVPPTPGGQSMAYAYDALPAGEYTYICSIHPIEQMTGTLKVQ